MEELLYKGLENPELWQDRQTIYFKQRGYSEEEARKRAKTDYDIKMRVNQEIEDHPRLYGQLLEEYQGRWHQLLTDHGLVGNKNEHDLTMRKKVDALAMETVRLIADATQRVRRKHPELSSETEIKALVDQQLEKWAAMEIKEIGEQGRRTANEHFARDGSTQDPEFRAFGYLRAFPFFGKGDNPQIKEALNTFHEQVWCVI